MEKELAKTTLKTAALAYLGDAVHALDVRTRAVEAGLSRSENLHAFGVGLVRAESQSRAFLAILPRLTQEEAELCRRAGNSKHLKAPRHASEEEYRNATALEALLGFLYVTEQSARLRELLDLIYQVKKED